MKKTIVYAIAFVGLFALAFWLFGCGSYPTKMRGTVSPDGTVEIETVEIGTAVPLTGVELSQSERTPASESGGWLGILTTGLALVGGLQFAGPKSWANWAAVLKPSTSWGTTGRALAANLGIVHTPKEAKSNETQEPVVTPANPNRSHP